MELDDAIRRRRMTRSFADRPIGAATLDELLALADHAPSAGGTLGTELLVLSTAEARATFWSHASAPGWRATSPQAPGLLAAPVLVLVLSSPAAYVERYAASDKSDSPLGGLDAASWPVPFWFVDAGGATMLLLLGALDRGLGALFFHVRGDRRALLDALGVPPDLELVGAVALGHPSAPPPSSATTPAAHHVRTRVHRERFGERGAQR